MKLELIENCETENKLMLDTKDKYEQWLKTLCAFSNTNGGVMNVGVADNFEIIGFTMREIDGIRRSVETICKNHTKPILKCKFEVAKFDNENEKYYLKIIVQKRISTITWLISQSSSPLLYVRHDGSTDLATLEEQVELINTTNLYEYDKVETGISFNESSFDDLEEEYRANNNGEILTKKKMISFGLLSADDFLTVAGVLFADNSVSKNANVVCTTWPSSNKGSNDYTDSKSYNGSLIYLLHQSISYISSVPYYLFGGEKQGLYRKDKGSFELVVVREALVNALAHRDYKIDGNEIAVNCFPDRIEITSPGSMLQLRTDILREKIDPDAFPSTRRNKTICFVFEKCRLMDNKGSGFEKIVEEYKYLGEEYAPLISSNRISFTITLKNKKYKYNGLVTKNNVETDNFDKITKKSMFVSRTNLYKENPKYEEIESAIFHDGKISIEEIATSVGLSKDGVKYNIRKMKDACLIRRVKNCYELVNDTDRPSDYLSLEKDVLIRAINWCKNNFVTNADSLESKDSFELKQKLEEKASIYLSNGQFKAVMLFAGFDADNIEKINWNFNVSLAK